MSASPGLTDPPASAPSPPSDATAVARPGGGRALGLALAGLAAVLALAYLRVLFVGETFAVRDHLAWTLPSRAFLAESLRQGHLPEWWDQLRLGDRFAADPNNGVTYPLAWLVALGDPLLGADLLLLLHVLLAGAGTLLFARRLGASPLGALFGAAAFMTSGYVTSMVVNGTVLMPLGWMPLVAWAALGVARAELPRARLREGLVFAGVLAGSVASGNPTGVYNVLLAAVVVLCFAERRLTALATLTAAGMLGGLMGAASVLAPFFTLKDSARAGGFSLAESGVWSMHPLRLIELLWPDLLGHGMRAECRITDFWVDSGGLGGSWSASDYVGFPVLCCAAVGALRGGRGLRRLGYVSLFFLLLALGTHTPLYGLYRAVFRFEQVLRYPEKHLATVLVLWSVLAAVGFDHLLAPGARWPRLLRASLAGALVLAAATGAGYALRGPLTEAIRQAAQTRNHGLNPEATVAFMLEGGLFAVAAVGLVVLALWLHHQQRLGHLLRPAFVAVVLAQLVVHAGSNQVLLSRELVRQRPAVLSYLPPAAGVPRMVRRAQDRSPINVAGELRALYLHQTAYENVATRFGFGQVPGYAIAGTQRFNVLSTASGKSNLERIMDLLDIRYLLIEAAEAGGMGMPSRNERPVLGHVVLENEVRRPRAFVAYRYRHGLADDQVLARLFAAEGGSVDLGAVFLAGAGGAETVAADAPSPCAITRPVPEHVILDCQAVRPGYAVLLDEWTQGWSATVDGAAAPIERADVVFRAVAIPAGGHRIELRYRTPGLRSGALIALFGWLAFLTLAAALKLSRSGSPPGSPPPRPVQLA